MAHLESLVSTISVVFVAHDEMDCSKEVAVSDNQVVSSSLKIE
jgi:hypothetical protein